jgi:serine-type D-Ala-D-Ala carboxypeptidase/endopeptidase (penicillin-binding protein 4)
VTPSASKDSPHAPLTWMTIKKMATAMQTRIKPRIVARVAPVLLLLLVSFGAPGQEPSKPTPAPKLEPTPLSSPQPTQSPTDQQTGSDVRPLYGYQGVLVQTLDGKVVASQSPDDLFNPASTIKLATALVALQTFGPDHRFATGIWTDGVIDKATGKIDGNLYISGRDPSFHYEHAVLLARELNKLGIKEVSGDLIVSPGFTMNFSSSAQRSGERLYDTLDSTLRHAVAIRAWTYERMLLKDPASLGTVPSVGVMGGVSVAAVSPTAKLLLTQRSSKLSDILKVLLCYSNNFMAERIGESLGGPEAVSQRLIGQLGVGPGELRLASLSGLGVNRVSPSVMMKIYRALRTELKKHRLDPSAIMPVAGIDPGTLEDRFKGLQWRGSVIAKTGTLIRTDGGASSLVGQLRAQNGEVLLFVIMNQSGSVSRFRDNQDYLVMLIQNTRGGPKAFEYKPVAMAMQLSNTESTVAATDEYEPKPKSQ